ncbi:DUF3662 domain-containing protein [Streptomyces iconiensis]|uniref:DUF3662 domain-containing protein n=1 Tax=Streptomyces iconiensis TaxID=1384038 RepID=A0ABT7A961_9ACTN|nr:DUF3662 domain-containing protein [Streptomyces iconiensis]MDJ1137351.1 DUF3662 domain-containing protein [Streptomyces iconiensis]
MRMMIEGFERAMERWAANVWTFVRGPRHKPMEVVAVLRKECDDNAMIVGHGRTLVPNLFTIELPHETHRRLDVHSAELAPQLAAQVRRHAAERRYTFAGPVTVRLHPAGDPGGSRYRVRSHVEARPSATPPAELTQVLPLPTP